MPTLSAMFKLYDRFSSTVKKISEGADKAAKAVLGASKKTDEYNESLKRTEKAANAANGGLARLIGTVAGFAAVKKGMDLTDTYTNTNARLNMITESMEEQKKLQNEIFASANRARGSYVEMANASAKLKMLAGDSFGSNQEALGFAELLTKSLKVSGAGQAEQNSAFLQLTQAMTSGKLQGDEFRSVMENAPMVADAIAKYMGKSKAELKELSSQGAITANIIKGAMFSAADDINGKFAQMPMTFADVWEKMKNTGMQAFGKVFEKANRLLNSDMGQKTVQNLTRLVYLAAGAFSALLDGIGWVGENLEWLGPIILAAASGFATYQLYAAGASVAQWALNSAMLSCPVFWIAAGLALAAVMSYKFASYIAESTGLASSGFGIMLGNISMVIAFFKNLGMAAGNICLGIWNAVVALSVNMNSAFYNSIYSIQSLFYDLMSTACSTIAGIAEALNKLPFVEFDYSGIQGAADKYASKSLSASKSKKGYESISAAFDKGMSTYDAFKPNWFSDAFYSGANAGDRISKEISGFVDGLSPSTGGGIPGIDFSQFATAGSPATVKGTGKGGAVKVENEEDISWMRKLAERDYVARIAQNTLAPNIRVDFSGPITKEADTDGVMAHVVEQLKDIIATAPEGVPA